MAWYNSSWLKRVKITNTGGASGAQIDYQMKYIVTWDSDMKSDFSDLRFTKANGTELLDAWLESKTDGISAVVWVETDTPADTVEADIYMYYGNSGAASVWDIGATFIFGDDAESGTYSDKWTDITGIGEYSTDQAYSGSKSIKFSSISNQTSVSKNIAVTNAVFEAMVKNVGVNNFYSHLTARASQSALTYYSFRPAYSGNAELFKRLNGTWTNLDEDASTDDPSSWHKWSILCNGSSIKTYFDDALRNEVTNADIASGRIGTRGAPDNNQYFDDVRIRKHVFYPATYSFGGEETETGWTGKIIGVNNPAKVFGIAVANISKVMGV